MDPRTCIQRPRQLIDYVDLAYERVLGVRPTHFPPRAGRDHELSLYDSLRKRQVLLVVDRHEVLQRHARVGFDVVGVAVRTTTPNRAYVRKGIPFWHAISTIGHELGHLILGVADEDVDEEAKAYAFETAWCAALVAGGCDAARETLKYRHRPAASGSDHHDRAQRHIARLARDGADMLAAAYAFSRGELHVPRNP